MGILINKAGQGRYLNEDSVEKLIRYITRARVCETRKQELVCWGALGTIEALGVESVIDDFKEVQSTYSRRGSYGRYIDHEIYMFDKSSMSLIITNELDMDKIARKMAQEFYQDGTQVVYAVHVQDEWFHGVHVHFAINTVLYETKGKRRENKTATKQKEKRFNEIVQSEIERQLNDRIQGNRKRDLPTEHNDCILLDSRDHEYKCVFIEA